MISSEATSSLHKALPLQDQGSFLHPKARIKSPLWLDFALGIAGLIILSGLIKFFGTHAIAQAFRKLGLWILPITLVYGLWQLCYTYAWTLTFVSSPVRFPFWKVFAVYLAGDAVNYGIPSGNLAGEPIKPFLMKSSWPLIDGMASVIVNKLSETLSMVLFLTIGILAGFLCFPLPLSFRMGVLIVFGGTVGAVSAFFWRQRKGLLAPVLSFLARIPFLSIFLQARSASATEIDRRVKLYYQTHSSRFRLSLLFNFLGWCGGAFEVFWILHLLGFSITLAGALAIEAFSLLVNNLFFFLPARVGGGESGKALIFSTLGFGAPIGLSFGIIRRVRELFWVSTGFVFLLAWRAFPQLKSAVDNSQ